MRRTPPRPRVGSLHAGRRNAVLFDPPPDVIVVGRGPGLGSHLVLLLTHRHRQTATYPMVGHPGGAGSRHGRPVPRFCSGGRVAPSAMALLLVFSDACSSPCWCPSGRTARSSPLRRCSSWPAWWSVRASSMSSPCKRQDGPGAMSFTGLARRAALLCRIFAVFKPSERRRQLSAGPLPVLAPWPAAGPTLTFLQLLHGPADAAFSGHGLLGIFHPADELIARQRCDVLPGVERRRVGDQRLA